MDWNKTFTKGSWVVHSIFAVAVLIAVGLTFFTLRLNHLQSTEEERSIKINALVTKMKNDDSFEKMGKYLSWAETNKAQDKMAELAKRIAQTEEMLEIKASKDLSASIKTFNKFINSTSGMSNPTDVLKVFSQKVQNLKDVSESRKYKNGTIIAERMEERLKQLTPKNVSGSPQISYLKSDLKRLEQLFTSSTLDEGEKKAMLNRIESMSNEVDLLSNLNTQSKGIKEQITQGTLALTGWALEAEKKAADFQSIKLKKQGQLIQGLAGLVAFLVTAWLGLAYLFRWQKIRMGAQVEQEVKGVIEKGILGDQRYMVDHYSDYTRDDIIGLLDGLKIKLNLGSMLHDGLPFAGCMVDNNFKLTWYNHLFLEQFYLSEEEVKSDSFNWDYLRDYLNLDEDPVYQALVNKIAGIYPIKVKQDEFTPMQPYEMYVTPITVNREDRVMIFFYPLVAVKEAITEQVNLAKDALNRFVTLWDEEKLDEDEIRLLEKDFKNNDLTETYTALKNAYERLTSEKTEYIATIRALEEDKRELEAEVQEWENLDARKKDAVKQEFKLAHELRDTFIESLEKGESLIQINRSILQQNDDLRTEAIKLQQQGSHATKKNRETLEILGQLESVKIDYKKLKLELLDVKTRLISINNTLFAQLPVLDENQQRLATRYKDELARLDFNVVTLDKKLSQLDLLLGKLSMMNEKAPLEQPQLNFQTTQKDHELKETLHEIQKTLTNSETKIVDSFKSLHQLMKGSLQDKISERPSKSTDLESFLS